MKKLYFRASLNIDDYYTKNIMQKDNMFLCRYTDDWKKIVQLWLRNCTDVNDRRIANGKEPCELEISIKSVYNSRTLKENALMWKIYDMQADILNREGQFVKNRITVQELYDQDMEGYAPIHTKTCLKEDRSAIIAFAEQGDCEYRGHLASEIELNDRIVNLSFRETSSFWDTAKFSEFLEYKINELEQMGVDRWNDGEVKALIDDFKSHLTKEKMK